MLSSRTGEHGMTTSLGKPSRKHLINVVDALATLLCALCLIGSIVVVSPSFSYAAQLAYTRQIIAVGFLLGVMTQCMLRTVPHAFLLIEARYGRSTLQNFDGILRWTPLANNLGAIWRLSLLILLLLPLGLSIGYKRYTGGVGYGKSSTTDVGLGPTAPPGTQGIGISTTVTNATSPFIAATTNSELLPDFNNGSSPVYGYNLVLLSETQAAALDAPLPESITSIQQALGSNEAARISADVRGTVSQYHQLTDSDRSNASWDGPWQYGAWRDTELYNGFKFGFLAVSNAGSDDYGSFNSSWIYLGAFNATTASSTDQISFQKSAALVTVSRKLCHATWNITSSSVILASATCDGDLWEGYQFYTNSQLGVADTMPPIMSEYLASFATSRNSSRWIKPTFAVSVAAMYQSRIASSSGGVPVQTNGLITNYWYTDSQHRNDSTFNLTTQVYTERYNGTLTSITQRPVLRADTSLYVLLSIQPFLTILGFLTICSLHRVPLAHGFGLILLLAGVERENLDILEGATLSGETKKSVSVAINIVDAMDRGGPALVRRLQYSIGRRAERVQRHQQLDTKLKYH